MVSLELLLKQTLFLTLHLILSVTELHLYSKYLVGLHYHLMFLKKELVHSLQYLVLLKQLVMSRLEQDYSNSYHLLMQLDQETLLGLEEFQYSKVLLKLLPLIQQKNNYYSLFLVLVQRNILKYMLDLVISLHSLVHLNLLLTHQNYKVSLDLLVMLMKQGQETLLDLVHLRNLVVLQNLLHSIHLKDNFYSPLQELDLRNILKFILVLEIYLHSLVHLNLLLIFKLVMVFGDLMVMLMRQEQETLLVLVHSRNSLDLLNLSPSIQQKNNYYSLLLVLVQVRSILNLMLVLDSLETLPQLN